MSCVWLNLVASEVVSLLQTFGIIFNAPTVCMHTRDLIHMPYMLFWASRICLLENGIVT